MIHKKKLDDYFIKDKKGEALICNAPSMQVFVPQRYEVNNLLTFGEETSVLAIFQMNVEGEKEPFNMFLPAILPMRPSSITQQKLDDVPYYVLGFKKGDIFISMMSIVKQSFVISKIFIEFMRNGNMPPFMSYDQMATVFDLAQITCGVKLPVPHAVMEMMVAHCARDSKNLNLKYRLSSMKEPPVFLGLRNITNVRDSTTSKVVGSYMMEGINSSIVNQSQQRSEIEDLLRS